MIGYQQPDLSINRNYNKILESDWSSTWNYSPDYSLNCTPLNPITIINQNYNKILERDWLSEAWFEH